MGSLIRFFIRVSAFFRKEIFEILRQPRLIMSLVLGPFLILLLFGIGYRNEARALRTIFVTEPGSPLETQIKENADSLGQQLIYVGNTADQEFALEQLRSGKVDLVAVAPPKAGETIQNNEQAVFQLYHNEIDPFQVDYVRYFGKIYIDEVNRRVLQTITENGQSSATSSRGHLAASRQSAAQLREALERGDAPAARQHQEEMNRELNALELTAGATVELISGVQQTLGQGETADTQKVRNNLSAVRQSSSEIGEIEDGQSSYEAQAERASEIESNLEALDSSLGNVPDVNSRVLVSPFRSESQGVASVQPEVADYFAPAVIVLLLQHLAVTFAALSIVRETQLGTVELFRVSPISAGETLLGKYLSYLLFGGVISIILTVLLIYALGVPMLGSWLYYGLAIGALLFTSLGVGFVISLIVDTDSQAVQYAMIILLSSVFFSGFFLSLNALWEPVRVVSWALPATYGIQLLQNIMLRGAPANPVWLGGLLGMGVLLYALSWFLMSRQMARG